MPFGPLSRIALAASVFAALAHPASSQEAIGVASVIRNEVSHGPAGRTVPLGTGENVVRRETVSTGRDSTAKLVFLDQTNLAIGPAARVVLDELVYPGEGARGRAVVDLTVGAFQFVSGKLLKESYQIRTPTATIGIRGTRFSVLSERGSTRVTLEEGNIVACARAAPSRCVVLREAGDTAVITAQDARRGAPGTAFSFAAAYCGSDPALCADASFAGSTRGPVVAALCGR